ncbi:MAG: hypothetical protein IKC79_03100 [Clostridia bacterium]|nr:hypothetical protein [Clostridia bacterium]
MDNLSKFKKMPLYLDITNNRAMHSIMLVSPDQDILDQFTQNIAMTMFCDADNRPCGTCANCQKILHHNCVDILEYPRRDSIIKRDDLEEIVSSVIETPYESDIKIYILRNMSSMDRSMQNKLLVSLEEPPHNTYFILQVTNESQVLPTIKSRCRKIYLPNYTCEELRNILDRTNATEEAITFCNGSLAVANSLLSNNNFLSNVQLVLDILLNYRKSTDTLLYSSKLYDCKDDFLDILNIYLRLLQDSNYVRLGLTNLLYSDRYVPELSRIAREFSVDAISNMVERAVLLREKLDRNCNYNALIDSFLLGILEVRHFCPIK